MSLALGLAGFALIAVLGALPTGLHAVREAQSQEIAANIAQHLQANLQGISFSAGSGGTDVANLGASVLYFTEDGAETNPPDHGAETPASAFYRAVFSVANASFNDGAAGSPDTPPIQAANARTVTVTLFYPQSGNVSGHRKFVYSFLLARQGASN